MRAYVPAYELSAPKRLSDALDRLGEGAARPFAGGTDLMVLFEAGKLEPGPFVSLLGVPELRGIAVGKEEIALGALTTYTEIRRHPVVSREYALLAEAARLTGAIAIQNRGTLGGNLANASPAADSPPALLVYGASVELVSRAGARRIPYEEFHLGYKKTALLAGEIVGRIFLPRPKGRGHAGYRKVGTRGAQAISKVCFAGRLEGKKEITAARLALGAVAPVPLRCTRTEAFLVGKRPTPEIVAEARALVAREIAPIDDLRSTGRYRAAVAGALVDEFLTAFAGGKGRA